MCGDDVTMWFDILRRGDCGIVCVGESGSSDGDIRPLAKRLERKKCLF